MRKRYSKTETTEPKPSVPMHQIGKIIRRLRFNEGDILLIRKGSELAKQDVLASMSKAIGQVIKKTALLMVVDDFNDLTTISEEEMNKSGWYKIETVYEILKRGYTMVPKKKLEMPILEGLSEIEPELMEEPL